MFSSYFVPMQGKVICVFVIFCSNARTCNMIVFSSYFVATQGNGEQNHQGPGDPGGGAEGQVLLTGNHDPRGEPAAHRRPLHVQE